MKLKCASLSELNKKTDVLVFPLHEGQRVLSGNSLKLDKSFQGAISRLLRQKSLSGKYEKLTPILGIPSQKPKTILAVGWGKPSRFSYASLREISGEIARKCKSLQLNALWLSFPKKRLAFPRKKSGNVSPRDFFWDNIPFPNTKRRKKKQKLLLIRLKFWNRFDRVGTRWKKALKKE